MNSVFFIACAGFLGCWWCSVDRMWIGLWVLDLDLDW